MSWCCCFVAGFIQLPGSEMTLTFDWQFGTEGPSVTYECGVSPEGSLSGETEVWECHGRYMRVVHSNLSLCLFYSSLLSRTASCVYVTWSTREFQGLCQSTDGLTVEYLEGGYTALFRSSLLSIQLNTYPDNRLFGILTISPVHRCSRWVVRLAPGLPSPALPS